MLRYFVALNVWAYLLMPYSVLQTLDFSLCFRPCLLRQRQQKTVVHDRVQLRPDRFTRPRVQSLHLSQIKMMRIKEAFTPFFGKHPETTSSSMSEMSFQDVVVKDKTLLAQMLQGLKHSFDAKGGIPGILTPTVEIVFTNVRQEPLTLHYNAAFFGPEYLKALHSLSAYQAQHIRQEIRKVAAHVTKVALFDEENTVTNELMTKRIVDELADVGESAIPYYINQPCAFPITLFLDKGAPVQILLAVPQYTNKNEPKPSLSPTLWNYYWNPPRSEKEP